MKKKNSYGKVLILLTLILLITLITSCNLYVEEEKIVFDNESNISEEPKDNVSIINDTQEQQPVVTRVNITGNKTQEQVEEEKEEEQVPSRVSEVEFYFLLKKKSFFRHMLKEQQSWTYNMSGFIVTIQPIIITQDSVKFRINDFTTKELREKDSDSTDEFEIIVKDIYYRG